MRMLAAIPVRPLILALARETDVMQRGSITNNLHQLESFDNFAIELTIGTTQHSYTYTRKPATRL